MKKLTLKSFSLSKKHTLLPSEKKEILGGQLYPCQPKRFCKGTNIPCDECAIDLPPADCNCTLGGL